MEMVPVDSRAIAAVGYDVGSRTLRIRFRHGGLYDYLDVAPEVYDGLVTETDPWSAWGAHITASYRFERLE